MIALKDRNGVKQGYFGPVITRVPPERTPWRCGMPSWR